jgi:hypothetical protein
VLLTCLARGGSAGPTGADAAFTAGSTRLRAAGLQARLLDASACKLENLRQALRRLDSSAPRLKREVLAASVATVLADQEISLAEAELLRAVADALGCPVPPFLPGEPIRGVNPG